MTRVRVPAASQVTVTRVIREIDNALALVTTGMAGRNLDLPPLKTATVTLQTTVSIQAGGGIKFLIFTFGGKWTKEHAQTLELVLALPKTLRRVPPPTIAQQLADAILSAAAGVADAGSRLVTKSVKIEVSFVVKSEETGGLKFTITPIDIDFSGNLTKNAIHKIALVFEKPDPK